MQILGSVPWNFESKVTALEASPLLDIMDSLTVFSKLEQFKTRINSSLSKSTQPLATKMKNLALYSIDSKLESEAESVALISRKIKKLIQKKNYMRKAKEKYPGAKREAKDSKEDACFECGKKGHYKRDCYKLKGKQQAACSKGQKEI